MFILKLKKSLQHNTFLCNPGVHNYSISHLLSGKHQVICCTLHFCDLIFILVLNYFSMHVFSDLQPVFNYYPVSLLWRN